MNVQHWQRRQCPPKYSLPFEKNYEHLKHNCANRLFEFKFGWARLACYHNKSII